MNENIQAIYNALDVIAGQNQLDQVCPYCGDNAEESSHEYIDSPSDSPDFEEQAWVCSSCDEEYLMGVSNIRMITTITKR